MENSNKRPLKIVVAGLLFFNGKLFAAARSENDERFGKFEFPGGKVEPGESNEEALKREISEELNMEIEVGAEFMVVEHAYDTFDIKMSVYLCNVLNPNFSLFVHNSGNFFTKDELVKLPFLGADKKVVAKIITNLDF